MLNGLVPDHSGLNSVLQVFLSLPALRAVLSEAFDKLNKLVRLLKVFRDFST